MDSPIPWEVLLGSSTSPLPHDKTAVLNLITTTIAKILILSMVISLGIKFSAHLGTIQGNNTIAAIMIMTPSTIMALWFWYRQRSGQG